MSKEADAFSVGFPDHENAPSGESQYVYGQMSLDPIRAFVETKPFRLNTGITSVFHRLRINHD